jgi:mono/diheme cytochrome c family protein
VASYRACNLLTIALAIIVSAWSVAALLAEAETTPSTEAIDFARDVKPILESRCFDCHGPDDQQSEFRLDRRADALRGGLSGPAIVPGDSGLSRLIEYIAAGDGETMMPPDGERLSPEQVAVLRAWIDAGAEWPDDLAGDSAAEAANPARWAFQPFVRPELPTVNDAAWPRGPIDRFVLARLEQAGLTPSPEADRRTLIRRLSFDLVGLPPTPEDVAAFVADERSDAYERLVDRLLTSNHYGERWGRHWLDVVRFAESHGFEMNQPRPNAWPYRDWVIAALNADLPYDQFVTAQLAGDRTGEDAATGFLVGGPWDQVKSPDPVLTAQQRADELHDMTSTTGSVFLGLTVGCARCHNHKFDPVSQRDYYALQAVLAGVEHGERPLAGAGEGRDEQLRQVNDRIASIEDELRGHEPLALTDGVEANEPPRAPVNARRNVDRFAPVAARWIRFTVLATNSGEPCIDEIEVYAQPADGQPARNVALAANGAVAAASGTLAGFDIHKLEHVNDGHYGNGRSWISDAAGAGWVEVEFPAISVVERVVWGRDRDLQYADRLATRYVIEVAAEPGRWQVVASSRDRAEYIPGSAPAEEFSTAGLSSEQAQAAGKLIDELTALRKERTALATALMIYAGRFTQPAATHRLHRGDPLQPREEVAPGAIAAVSRPLEQSADAAESARREALARWITSHDNPLTARVMVNRIWQHHFGQGLVATPSDFGANGARPTHPELLDWLADEFVTGGWRMKALHRRIVTSAAYRQASAPRADALAKDAGTQLLWRFPPRRLEAEPIRDSILAVSGTLNLAAGGPGYEVFEPNDNYVHVYAPKVDFGPAEWRRMIYQNKPRMEQDEVFGTFDCPDAGQVAPRRNRSTTPLQALNLLNSRFMLQQSALFAERLQREAGPDVDEQVRRAFQLAFQRDPHPAELAAAAQLIAAHGTPVFCRALLNANEFIHTD